MRTILVTGGAGFIGTNFVLSQLAQGEVRIINLDKLTYAGNLENLMSVMGDPRHLFVQGDISNRDLVAQLLMKYRPVAIVHFAAETHVDRSIDGPAAFVQTNVVGTLHLLEAARDYWGALAEPERSAFRFLHVSTDEVFGSLGATGYFTEETPYAPNSPYAASKAAADHLVRAYHRTYGLPTITTHCSNNYGPYQFPEKLIPLMILSALQGKPLPVYGDGQHIRDWLYVEDHCRAIAVVLERGHPSETYNVGGHNEKTNLEVVRTICDLLDQLVPRSSRTSYSSLITFVPDRPGHDRRYAIDASKIERELGWRPQETFETGLAKTIGWYLDHREWWERMQSGKY